MSNGKLLLSSVVLASLASASALAGSPTAKVGGEIDVQYGHKKTKGPFKYSIPGNENSNKVKTDGIVHDAYINFNVDGKADNGLEYGGLVRLNASSTTSKKGDELAEQVMLYASGAFGKVELGSYTGSTHALKVNAANFASADGGINGDYRYWVHPKLESKIAGKLSTNPVTANLSSSAYILTPNLWSNEVTKNQKVGDQKESKDFTGVQRANANKITYYTPEASGFTLGVSYIPDSESHGTIKQLNEEVYKSSYKGYKNIFEAGIHYSTQIDKVGVKAALVGQYGKPKQKDLTIDSTQKFEATGKRKLAAWEAGVNVNYMGVTAGASYGSWGKTDQYKNVKVGDENLNFKSKDSRYWTAGLGYECGPMTTSLTYMTSERYGSLNGAIREGLKGDKISIGKNKADVYSLGLDYKLAPGFMPYASVTHAKLKDGRKYKNNEDKWAGYQKEKATIVLVGTKLHF